MSRRGLIDHRSFVEIAEYGGSSRGILDGGSTPAVDALQIALTLEVPWVICNILLKIAGESWLQFRESSTLYPRFPTTS